MALKEYKLGGIGPLGLENGASEGPTMFAKILSIVVGVMTFVAGIWFLLKIITAGYTFISSGGDANKLKEAQSQIINSLIGILIVVAAIFLLSLVGDILHVDFLDVVGMITSVWK